MKTKAGERLIVSKPFLDELRDRVAISALNDEAPMETIYLQKAADEIEWLQRKLAKFEKMIVKLRCGPTVDGGRASARLYKLRHEVHHGDHEYHHDTYFAARNRREAGVHAKRETKNLFGGSAKDEGDGVWSACRGEIMWHEDGLEEVREMRVESADGNVCVFDVARRPPGGAL